MLAKFDEELRKLSHEAEMYLHNLDEKELRETQEYFLASIMLEDDNLEKHESGIKELFSKFFG